MRGLSLVLAGIVCVAGLACGQNREAESLMVDGRRILKVAVFADGRITADGSTITLAALRESLKGLAAENGEVWYYREAGQGELPPEAMAVTQFVVDNRLPIRLSTRPDYSDAVGPAGPTR